MYLELVQLQLVGIFTNTKNVLQIHRCLDVLNAKLLQPRKLKTQSKFVHIHNEKNILDVTYVRKEDEDKSFLT